MQPLELGVIGGHAAIVERQRVHALLRHILLCEYDGQLLGPVVPVVEEDHHVVRPDHTDRIAVLVDPHDGLHELVGHPFVVRLLHRQRHIGRMFALALDQQVVGHLHTLPTLVAVHRVITAYDRGHDARRSFPHVLFQPFDESLAAVRIGIAAVHKAMHVGTFDTVFIGDVRQFEQVIQRRVHPAVRNQSHQVHAHPVRFGVFERLHDFGILQNRIVAAGPVDLHQILIDHPPRTDIEVPTSELPICPSGRPTFSPSVRNCA